MSDESKRPRLRPAKPVAVARPAILVEPVPDEDARAAVLPGAARPIETLAAAAALLPEPLIPHAALVVPPPVAGPDLEATSPSPSAKEEIMTEFQSAEQMKNGADAMARTGTEMFAQVSDRARSTVEQGVKAMGELGNFGRDNMAAFGAAGRAAAQGMETMAQQYVDFVRRSLDDTMEAMREMATVKSPADALRLHGEFVRKRLDVFVAEASRTTETMLKVAGEVVEPLQSRAAVATDHLAKMSPLSHAA